MSDRTAHDSAGDALGARSDHPLGYASREKHPLVEAFLDRRWRRSRPGCPDPCLDIAAGDEMFAYALTEQHQHRGLALVSYLRSGLTACETLLEILAWRFSSLGRVPSLLDFASGYGRTTRFLVSEVPSERITIGEISRAALDFQRACFEVETLASERRPESVALGAEHGREYGAVVAFSLFTHLPREPFGAWLESLWRAVAPGGVLIFSVNGEEVLFGSSEMPQSGFFFEPVSESHSLGADDYGSTWVSERFVRAAVEGACSGANGCFRIERGLWHFQDLYVVTRPSASDETPYAQAPGIALPPEGYLDTCILLDRDRLQVAGWAIDRQRPDVSPLIRVLLNGAEVASCRAQQERKDLGALLGEEFLRSGWVVEVEARTAKSRTARAAEPDGEDCFGPHDVVLVEAESASGRRTVLHLSELEGADLVRRVSGALEETRAQNLHLRAENVELERRIAAMEKSRFWKLRNMWFRARRLIQSRRRYQR